MTAFELDCVEAVRKAWDDEYIIDWLQSELSHDEFVNGLFDTMADEGDTWEQWANKALVAADILERELL